MLQRRHDVLAGGDRVVAMPTRGQPSAASDTPPIRVFLVDAQEVTRRGVTRALEDDPGIRVVGEASSSEEALRRGVAVRPDVAVVETPELCSQLRAALAIPCLVLTQDVGPTSNGGAARAGAAGLLAKGVSSAELVAAVRSVAAGTVLFDRATVASARPRSGTPANDRLRSLSDREQQLLELLGHGLTNRAIATRMGLTEKTVKNYVSHVLGKLGLTNRTQAAILATQLRSGRARPASSPPTTSGFLSA